MSTHTDLTVWEYSKRTMRTMTGKESGTLALEHTGRATRRCTSRKPLQIISVTSSTHKLTHTQIRWGLDFFFIYIWKTINYYFKTPLCTCCFNRSLLPSYKTSRKISAFEKTKLQHPFPISILHKFGRKKMWLLWVVSKVRWQPKNWIVFSHLKTFRPITWFGGTDSQGFCCLFLTLEAIDVVMLYFLNMGICIATQNLI